MNAVDKLSDRYFLEPVGKRIGLQKPAFLDHFSKYSVGKRLVCLPNVMAAFMALLNVRL